MQMEIVPAADVFLTGMRLDGSWSGGSDEQEDELDDVAKGKLQPPTKDPVPGDVVIRPNRDADLIEEDEAANGQG